MGVSPSKNGTQRHQEEASHTFDLEDRKQYQEGASYTLEDREQHQEGASYAPEERRIITPPPPEVRRVMYLRCDECC